MTRRRRSRTQQKAGEQRAGKPRTLRTRLVVASVVLIAVVCAVIGTVTTLALRSHLYEQLDGQVTDAGGRLSGPPLGILKPGDRGPGDSSTEDRLEGFVTKGPTQEKTVAAQVGTNGTITRAVIAQQDSTDNGAIDDMSAVDLTDAQKAELAEVPTTGTHTVTLPGLGDYRVRYVEGAQGSYYVALPTADVDNTINTLILVEVSVTGAGLVAAGIASSVLVGVATRALRLGDALAEVHLAGVQGEFGDAGGGGGDLRRRPTRTPRSAGSAPRSTGCWTTSTAPCTPASTARCGYGSSSRTPAMSCVRRSPPSADTPS